MILTDRGLSGRSLLAQAAFGGDTATFEIVLTALREKLQPDQVKYHSCCKGDGSRIKNNVRVASRSD